MTAPGEPKLLWVTDSWHTLDHRSDTTLRLAEEAWKLGIPQFWCDPRSIQFHNGEVLARAHQLLAFEENWSTADSIKRSEPRQMQVTDFTRIIYRTDPPVDLAYLHPLQLLVLGVENEGKRRTSEVDRIEIVNSPSVILSASEKLEGSSIKDLLAPALVASRWSDFCRYGRAEGRTVLKPLHQAQSKGVTLLDWRSKEGMQHARQALHDATDAFRRPALVQRYLEGIREGEQRLWFLNGELLGAIRKKPRQGEFRINMDQGGSIASTTLNAAEKAAAERIGQHLKDRRIRMAAVDLIEGLITDFNYTSPGLLRQMERLLERNLARPIIESLVKPWDI